MRHLFKLPALHFLLISVCLLLLLLILQFGLAVEAKAHDSEFPFRYVAPNGIDTGHCDDPRAPCRTILYAVNQAMLGEQIRVAAGTYFFDNSDISLLLSEVILVTGGFSLDDAFTVQEPVRYATFLIGPDDQYEQPLLARGFKLIQDAKAIGPDRVERHQPADLQTLQNAPAEATPCSGGAAAVYSCKGIDLLGRVPLSQFSLAPGSANDIWGYVNLNDNKEYAIIGLSNGTAVVDVTDPYHPIEVGAIPGTDTIWRDVKVYQFFNSAQSRWDAYAYVTADKVNDGLQIINLSNLPAGISLANAYTGFLQAHNIYIGNVDYTTAITLNGPTAHAYIFGSDVAGGLFRILDLTNPTAPTEVAAGSPGTGYVHDGTALVITDTRASSYCDAGHNPCELYVDFNENTVDIWDVTEKDAPSQISSTPYTGSSYTHSGWWSADKMFIFVQDELDEFFFGHNTRLRVLDISDLTKPFVSHIWEGPTRAIDHNGYAKASHYYMSNYRRGLTILDVANPNETSDIAYFDTFPTSDSPNFNGAWGVYPYLPSGTILVSDIEGGLFLLKEQGLAIVKSGPSSVSAGELVTYTLTLTNHGILPATNIVITDRIPAGAVYVSGGSQSGGVASWPVANLDPGQETQVKLVVFSENETILNNHKYGAQADGSVSALGSVNVNGSQPVITMVGKAGIYLPFIVKK